MIAALGGVDMIVFTGGIGENDAEVLSLVLEVWASPTPTNSTKPCTNFRRRGFRSRRILAAGQRGGESWRSSVIDISRSEKSRTIRRRPERLSFRSISRLEADYLPAPAFSLR
jgi:hypothetical protein